MLLFGMHDVHLYQFSTKSNFASKGYLAISRDILLGTTGIYWVEVRDAAGTFTAWGIAHHKEFSSPKCQECSDWETLVYINDEDDNFHMNSFNK